MTSFESSSPAGASSALPPELPLHIPGESVSTDRPMAVPKSRLFTFSLSSLVFLVTMCAVLLSTALSGLRALSERYWNRQVFDLTGNFTAGEIERVVAENGHWLWLAGMGWFVGLFVWLVLARGYPRRGVATLLGIVLGPTIGFICGALAGMPLRAGTILTGSAVVLGVAIICRWQSPPDKGPHGILPPELEPREEQPRAV